MLLAKAHQRTTEEKGDVGKRLVAIVASPKEADNSRKQLNCCEDTSNFFIPAHDLAKLLFFQDKGK